MAKYDMSNHIYDNTRCMKRVSIENKKPTTEKKWKPSRICVVVVAVLLFLSLVVNGIMAFFYFTKDKNASLHCEPVPNCSNSDPFSDHEQDSPGCTYKEDWRPIKYCPGLPEQWFKGNGAFYLFSSNNRTWNSSNNYCKNLGGDLVTIDNPEEKDFLTRRLCVIGENELYWSGTVQDSNCVVFKGNTQENALCSREERSICEFPCSS